MDSALKQRLLGAAVLIALAIIFVPMFLSNSPPKQDRPTVSQEIPVAPERKFEVRTLPVDAPAAPVPNKPDAASDPNRIVTVEQGWPVCSIASEISAAVVDEAFDYLDAPVKRVAGKDVPLPYAANLERLAVPQVEDIVAAAREVAYR